MANITVGTNYVGQQALPFVAPAILAADTLANGYISIKDNVRFKAQLKKVSGGSINARSCEFTTPSAGIALSDVTLTTTQLQVNEQLCNKDVALDWGAAQMSGAYANNPRDYVNFIAGYVAAIVAKDVEQNIWAGSYNFTNGATTGAVNSFAGIMNAYVAGAGSNEVTGALPLALTAVVSTSLDFLDQLALTYAAIPDDIAGDPDTLLFMSRKSAGIYYDALAATYNLPFLNEGVLQAYKGYKIVTPAGFPNDTFIFSKVDNLYFGSNLMTDMIDASILDLSKTTGDDVTRIIMNFDAGTQIGDEASMAVWRRTA